MSRRPAALPAVGEAELTAWLVQAAPGDRFAYWRGHLAIDACPVTSGLHGTDRARLSAAASLAWIMQRKGWVHLVQQRHGARDYSYFAVARPLTELPAADDG